MTLLTPDITQDLFQINDNAENIPPFCSPSFLTIYHFDKNINFPL
jgi:hypothetical protein